MTFSRKKASFIFGCFLLIFVASMWLLADVIAGNVRDAFMSFQSGNVKQSREYIVNLEKIVRFASTYSPIYRADLRYVLEGVELVSEGVGVMGAWKAMPMFIEDPRSCEGCLVTTLHQSTELFKDVAEWESRMSAHPTIQYFIPWEAKQVFESLRTHKQDIQILGEISEHILSNPEKQTYIVLLQNNMELRPTGGFMGSYLELTFENSLLTSSKVQDIYVPDGQLKGYVKPPQPVEQYLFQSGGWKLRDANWDPHFPRSAQAIQWFFEHGGYDQVDGVIAMNFRTARKMLELLQPIHLSDYNYDMTAEQAYTFIQSETEQHFFPGATHKKDVLNALLRAMLRTFQETSLETKRKVVETLFESLSNHDTMLWFEDVNLQQLVMEQGWDGSIRAADCGRMPNCIADTLFLVEANVGINKTNCCLERKVGYDIWIDERGGVKTTVNLDYVNNNPPTPDPPRNYGGGYKNYLRLYRDPSQILTTKVVNRSHEKFIGQSVISDGVLIEVPGKTSKSFQFEYSDMRSLDLNLPSRYTLHIQRQAGVDTGSYQIRVHHPQNLQIRSSHAPEESSPDLKIISLDLQHDETITFDLQ